MCIMVYVKKVNGGFFEEIIQKVCPINGVLLYNNHDVSNRGGVT